MFSKPAPTIFAIGGGELADGETLPIDKLIVSEAKQRKNQKRSPVNALFIPTASGDDVEYYDIFKSIYARRLRCKTDVLYLYGNVSSKTSIADKINWSDMVYVGGGSTPSLMRMWRKYGVDRYLTRAWKRGVVMAGLSAGAICWFSVGLSNAYTNRWTAVKCLGLVNFACNVHYSTEKGRKKAFDLLVKRERVTGIALEDNACICIKGNSFSIIKSKKQARVLKIVCRNSRIKRHELTGYGSLSEIPLV